MLFALTFVSETGIIFFQFVLHIVLGIIISNLKGFYGFIFFCRIKPRLLNTLKPIVSLLLLKSEISTMTYLLERSWMLP